MEERENIWWGGGVGKEMELDKTGHRVTREKKERGKRH